jgi:hypothetical protein
VAVAIKMPAITIVTIISMRVKPASGCRDLGVLEAVRAPFATLRTTDPPHCRFRRMLYRAPAELAPNGAQFALLKNVGRGDPPLEDAAG